MRLTLRNCIFRTSLYQSLNAKQLRCVINLAPLQVGHELNSLVAIG